MTPRHEHISDCSLPPREFWLYDAVREGKIETPHTEGIVRLNDLIAVVRKTIAYDYDWESCEVNLHHLQWPATLYQEAQRGLSSKLQNVPVDFRELPNRKVMVQRLFHNWIHRTTTPPPMPTFEAMHYSVLAHRAAMGMTRTASLMVGLSRNGLLSERTFQSQLDREFNKYNNHLEAAKAIPEEFQLLQPARFELASPRDILRVNNNLAKLALDRVPSRTKSVKSGIIR